METKIEKKYLKCELNEDELAILRDELAEKTIRLRQLESDKAVVAAQFAADIKRIKEETDGAAQTLSNKSEYRNVDCEFVYDYDDGTVTCTRTDTGEIISTRTMTNNELQLNAFEVTENDTIEE